VEKTFNTVYQSTITRLGRLYGSSRNRVVKSQVAQVIAFAESLLRDCYCETHFVEVLSEYLCDERSKHAKTSVSYEVLEVCRIALQMAVEDTAQPVEVGSRR
jgi:hypothetical protein